MKIDDSQDKEKDLQKNNLEPVVIGEREQAVLKAITGGKWKKYTRVGMAALGSIPWVGSMLSATATLSAENEQGKNNEIFFLWVKEHEIKIRELGLVLNDMFTKFESFGDRIQKRIESEEYLTLVRKAFKAWDRADTQDKRLLFKKIITNAGGMSLCPDDLIRLFIDWVDRYHEAHFLVIREIYDKKSITRGAIWDNINPTNTERPPDNSPEAGLFGYLIRELTLGGVIHQEKNINSIGQFVKSKRSLQKSKSDTMESYFEDTKPIVLTELGKEFVHYVLDDLVPQLENKHI